MKFTTEWLKEYLGNEIDNDRIYRNLEKSGFEFVVNKVSIKESHGIITGKVRAINQDKKLKKLKNYILSIGKKTLEIVSPIDNVSVGDTIAVNTSFQKKKIKRGE